VLRSDRKTERGKRVVRVWRREKKRKRESRLMKKRKRAD